MEASLICLFYYYVCIIIITMCGSKLVEAIESPKYTVATSESNFEIRLYSESSWLSASVQGTSFTQSTRIGFHRLYQYMHGGNMDSSRMAFTAPVLTSITSSTSSSSSPHGNDYVVMSYMSEKYNGKPPEPNPELNLQVETWKAHCIAVRKFSGFATDDNINTQVEALRNSLSGRAATIQDKGTYAIAQYNDSRHISGRLNEVWIHVSGPFVQGCPPSQSSLCSCVHRGKACVSSMSFPWHQSFQNDHAWRFKGCCRSNHGLGAVKNSSLTFPLCSSKLNSTCY